MLSPLYFDDFFHHRSRPVVHRRGRSRAVQLVDPFELVAPHVIVRLPAKPSARPDLMEHFLSDVQTEAPFHGVRRAREQDDAVENSEGADEGPDSDQEPAAPVFSSWAFSRTVGPDGRVEERRHYHDSTGQSKLEEARTLDSGESLAKRTRVVFQKDADASPEETVTFEGPPETKESFDKLWDQTTKSAALPNLEDGAKKRREEVERRLQEQAVRRAELEAEAAAKRLEEAEAVAQAAKEFATKAKAALEHARLSDTGSEAPQSQNDRNEEEDDEQKA